MARNLHLRQSCLRAMARAEGFFARAKDFILPDTLFAPALAPAFAGQATPHFTRFADSSIAPHVFGFMTNDMPKRGTVARDIMDWKPVGISQPVAGKQAPPDSITYGEAQKEVARALDGRKPCHEYIAYEAAKMCGNNPLVARYTLHILVGAAAEDFAFAPGESFENLYASKPKRALNSRADLSGSAIPEPSRIPSFFQGIMTMASRIGAYFSKGKADKDELNRPYFAHFYDPSRKADDQGLSLLGGDVRFKTAKDRARMYWHLASGYYASKDMPRAFCALGHLVHLISDMHVPAHVHNDVHGPNVILGKPDSLENWLVRADYPHIARTPDEPNARIWGGKQLKPPEPDRSWHDGNVDEKLGQLVERVVAEARGFRSVDAQGTNRDEKKTGSLSDDECFRQANVLIPGAISHSAQIIANFMDYHERGGIPRPDGWTPAGTT